MPLVLSATLSAPLPHRSKSGVLFRFRKSENRLSVGVCAQRARSPGGATPRPTRERIANDTKRRRKSATNAVATLDVAPESLYQ